MSDHYKKLITLEKSIIMNFIWKFTFGFIILVLIRIGLLGCFRHMFSRRVNVTVTHQNIITQMPHNPETTTSWY